MHRVVNYGQAEECARKLYRGIQDHPDLVHSFETLLTSLNFRQLFLSASGATSSTNIMTTTTTTTPQTTQPKNASENTSISSAKTNASSTTRSESQQSTSTHS